MVRRLATHAVAICFVTMNAAADVPTLSPLGTLAAPGGIEWATLRGPPGAEVLVTWTTDRDLCLLDVRDGRRLLAEHLDASPGLRPAAGYAPLDSATPAAFRLHCYDLQSLHTLRIEEGAGGGRTALLQAQIGRGFAPKQYQQDPEFLVTPIVMDTWGDDVLVVRSDGSLVLFDAERGRVRTGRQLSPIGDHDYYRDGDHTALLWKHTTSANLLFLKHGDELTDGTPRRLGETLPVWGTLTPDGLLALWLDHYEVWSPAATHGLRHDLSAMPRAALVTLCRDGDEHGGVLVYADAQNHLHGIDIMTGRQLWEREPDATPRRLLSAGQHVLSVATHEITLLDARTGARQAAVTTLHNIVS
ncbi:MAG: PQQ-binding-like beta-propeller repeat protein, partial [Phycisphaerae bacterium]|nr:PQQ-binding-like beta-propeller repeat protein [Phycisphaerae bacterium]